MEKQLSITECLAKATQQLLAAGEGSRLDAEVLMATVLDCDRAHLFAYGERLLDATSQDVFFHYLQRRQLGEPVAYITGNREFWSLPLAVDSSTLIPRADTEVLVETALALCKKTNAHVIDLGTGTGAIALALAAERPAWTIDAVDFHLDAVQLAKKNVSRINAKNVNVYHGYWFAATPKEIRFDMVVSNPPYISADDKHLVEGDVRFEPRSALVAEDDGYADLFFIAQASRNHLCCDGLLLLEHGYEQGARLRDYLQQCGYQNIQTVRDYGGHERVTHATWLGDD